MATTVVLDSVRLKHVRVQEHLVLASVVKRMANYDVEIAEKA